MKINVEKCAGLLKDRDNILILCHAHPDGDTLGCGYALLRALQKQGKTVRLECADEIPKKYSYLYDDITVSDFNEEYVIAAMEIAGGRPSILSTSGFSICPRNCLA